MSELHKPGIAIMASGEGTLTREVIKATQNDILGAEVGLVICNRPAGQAGVYDVVKRANNRYGLDIKMTYITGEVKGTQTDTEAERINEELGGAYAIVLLAGYLRKVHPAVIKANRFVMNDHCGPLPLTAGLIGVEAQRLVLAHGLPDSGHVLHFVDEGYDTGIRLYEHVVPVQSGSTPETLFADVKISQRRHLPLDLHDFISINDLNR